MSSLNSLNSSMMFMIVLSNSVFWISSKQFSLADISAGLLGCRGDTDFIFHVACRFFVCLFVFDEIWACGLLL